MGWTREVQTAILDSPVLADLRLRLDATPAQIALAWLLDLAPNVLLMPATRTRQNLAENIRCAEVRLDDAARTELARHSPIADQR